VVLDHVGSYHHSLIQIMDELFKVDSTISFFPYGLPNSDEATILKLGSTLGSTVTQISSYFDGFWLTREIFPLSMYPSSLVLIQNMIPLAPTAKPNWMEFGPILPSILSKQPRSLLLGGSLAPMVILTLHTWPHWQSSRLSLSLAWPLSWCLAQVAMEWCQEVRSGHLCPSCYHPS